MSVKYERGRLLDLALRNAFAIFCLLGDNATFRIDDEVLGGVLCLDRSESEKQSDGRGLLYWVPTWTFLAASSLLKVLSFSCLPCLKLTGVGGELSMDAC